MTEVRDEQGELIGWICSHLSVDGTATSWEIRLPGENGRPRDWPTMTSETADGAEAMLREIARRFRSAGE